MASAAARSCRALSASGCETDGCGRSGRRRSTRRRCERSERRRCLKAHSPLPVSGMPRRFTVTPRHALRLRFATRRLELASAGSAGWRCRPRRAWGHWTNRRRRLVAVLIVPVRSTLALCSIRLRLRRAAPRRHRALRRRRHQGVHRPCRRPTTPTTCHRHRRGQGRRGQGRRMRASGKRSGMRMAPSTIITRRRARSRGRRRRSRQL